MHVTTAGGWPAVAGPRAWATRCVTPTSEGRLPGAPADRPAAEPALQLIGPATERALLSRAPRFHELGALALACLGRQAALEQLVAPALEHFSGIRRAAVPADRPVTPETGRHDRRLLPELPRTVHVRPCLHRSMISALSRVAGVTEVRAEGVRVSAEAAARVTAALYDSGTSLRQRHLAT